jgi:hypothetical protein
MSNQHARWIGFCLLAFTLSLLVGRAGASIGRTQTFDIGAVNRVLWTGGIGSAQGQNQISFNQTQQASEHYRYGGLSATQTGRGSLTQTATLSGTDPSKAGQTATIKGTQDLLGQTSPYAATRGRQDLEVKLDTRLVQPSGIGTATGTQTYNGLQEQSLTSACGTSSQSQSADVRQSGTISTETNVDPIVTNKITIGMHQSQVTNGQ